MAVSMVSSWCVYCGARHPPAQACPRAIVPTGPEERCWQVAVETPRGIEGYGVLLAPSGNRWRARIVTFPNILWMVPGGGESIKFLARSEDVARREAIEFVRRHCLAKGFLMRDQLQHVRSSSVPVITSQPGLDRIAAPRHRRNLIVRFGRHRPILLGQTDNVSEQGLFISTEHPLAQGDSVGMSLDLDYCRVTLRGSVVWQRPEPSLGLPQGMGLRLVDSPSLYVSYIRALL